MAEDSLAVCAVRGRNAPETPGSRRAPGFDGSEERSSARGLKAPDADGRRTASRMSNDPAHDAKLTEGAAVRPHRVTPAVAHPSPCAPRNEVTHQPPRQRLSCFQRVASETCRKVDVSSASARRRVAGYRPRGHAALDRSRSTVALPNGDVGSLVEQNARDAVLDGSVGQPTHRFLLTVTSATGYSVPEATNACPTITAS